MNYTRARNYRLYCSAKRILDLELDGGRCLLGHNPKGLGKTYKNSISRGLYTALPNAIHARTVKLIRTIFPAFQAVIIPDRMQALKLLASVTGCDLTSTDFSLFNFKVPYRNSLHSGHICLWRPFSGLKQDEADIMLPIIPQPGYAAPQVILYKQSAGFHPRNIPLCSPIFLYGLHHVLLLLQRALHYGSLGSVAKMDHQPRKHRESLGITRPWFREEQWRRFLPSPSNIWERRGPYIYLKLQNGGENLNESWATLKAEYPELQFPTHATQVLILPSLASYGEQRLINSFFEQTENSAMQEGGM